MLKKQYTFQNNLDAKKIFNDLLNIYKNVEKIKKKNDDNVAGILFHELVYFFVSIKCRDNLKRICKIVDNNPKIIFGKRNNQDIFKLKQNSFLTLILFKIYKFLIYFFKFKKKIYLNKSISLNFKNKISLILFSLVKKYEIELVNFNHIKMYLSSETKLFFLKEIKKLIIKNKINLKNLNYIKNFIKKIETKKEYKFKFSKVEKNLILSGTLADIQNRLFAIKKKKINAKLITINHITTFGFVSFKALKFDEFYLCDYYLTSGKNKKVYNDDNYYGIDNNNYKVISIPNKNNLFFAKYVKKVNFKKLNNNKILYIPNRVANASLNGKDYLYKKHYEQWQEFLATKFGKIDIKYPYKSFTYNINNKFNVLDNKLKLLKICNNYDLIIIDFISSSTFSEIASTSAPIIYFNINRDQITKRAREIVKQRALEVKVDILNNFKGFEIVNKFILNNRKKNVFFDFYFKNSVKKTFYQSLLNISNNL